MPCCAATDRGEVVGHGQRHVNKWDLCKLCQPDKLGIDARGGHRTNAPGRSGAENAAALIGEGKQPSHSAFVVLNMHMQQVGGHVDATSGSATATAESADFIAEAMSPAHLPRPAYASAAVAISGEGCYCKQAFIDRERRTQLEPFDSADPYAGTLARWFGVSNRELDAILRDL